jgi:hypothetical protein
MFADDSIPFALRLAQTVAWCEMQARLDAPATCLRTIERRTLPVDRADDVHCVAIERANSLRGQALDLDAGGWRARGRLMVYFPDLDTADGGAWSTSSGYFDMHAAPPCDTWIAIGRAEHLAPHDVFLLAWVPSCFLALAQQGIAGDAMGSLIWLDADAAIAAAVARELAR